jgi:hypothetical protein
MGRDFSERLLRRQTKALASHNDYVNYCWSDPPLMRVFGCVFQRTFKVAGVISNCPFVRILHVLNCT